MTTLKCMSSEVLDPLVASLDTHPLLRTLPIAGAPRRLIGCLIDHDGPAYKATVPAMNVDLATHFPLAYYAVSQALFALKRTPLYPQNLGLPAILPDGPVPTKLASTYLNLTTGEIQFDPPSGPCMQFHIVPRGRYDILFA